MLNSGGIGTYLKNIIIHLKTYPLHMKLLIHPSMHQQYSFLDTLDCIHCNASIYSIKEQWQLPRLIPACDIFWSPHFNVPFLPIKAKKQLVTIHDVCHLALASFLSPLERIYAKKLIRTAIRKSEKIITGSHFSSNELRRYTGVDDSKVSVIYYGIDHFYFDNQSSITHVQQKYQLPERFVLFVGNLKPHKNLTTLMKAFKELISHDPSLYLVIVGKSKGMMNRENITAWLQDAKLSKHLLHLSEVEDEDLPAIYQLALCLAFPSLYEGFGLPPLEAMKVGCPVLASSIAPVREVCQENVLYVDPCSIKEITSGIFELVNDATLRTNLILKGKEWVKQYTWKKSAEEHFKILNEITKDFN